jgi:hypothetical protein
MAQSQSPLGQRRFQAIASHPRLDLHGLGLRIDVDDFGHPG